MKDFGEYYDEAIEQAKADAAREAPRNEHFPGPTYWLAQKIAMVAAMRQAVEDARYEAALKVATNREDAKARRSTGKIARARMVPGVKDNEQPIGEQEADAGGSI